MNNGMLQSLSLSRRTMPRLTPTEAAGLRVLRDQKFVLSFPYWSVVRVRFARSGAGPFTYTMNMSEVTAFSYAVGDSEPATAGFTSSGLTMGYCETNIQSRNETIAGEELHIRGIGIQPCAGTDARLAALVWRNTSAIIAVNAGTNRLPIGPLSLIPGGGGLTGAGPDDLGTQAIPGGRPAYGSVTNGWPVRKNLMELPEGIIWRNKARRDGQFGIILQPALNRTVTYTTQIADEVAAAGIRGYSFPATVYVDAMVWLEGQIVSRRSKVM